MAKKRDDSSGRYVEKATLEDVLEVFDTVDGPPVVTSADVADATDLSRDSARRKLETLHDRGSVAKRKTAGRVLYWPTDTPDAERTRERGETPVEETAEPTTTKPGEARDSTTARRDVGTTGEGEHETGDSVADAVDAIAEDVLPGSGAKLEARREAFRAAVEYLREHGTATPEDFRTDVYPDYTGHYTEGKDPARSWWKNCIYKALRELAERTDAVAKADTTGEWSWQGGST